MDRRDTLPTPPFSTAVNNIGSFHPHKGIQVLLEAFRALGDRASLHIHGSSFGSPVSDAYFRSIMPAASAGIVVHGGHENERPGEIQGTLDVVVVPSVRYENSPLTIQEAQIVGVPVITGNEGGHGRVGPRRR